MTESFPHSGWAEAYYAPVYYHALKRCGNVWDAADAVSYTHLDVYKRQHEIPDDIGMGNRHRPALFDLLTEQRNYRPVGPQHITEAHRHIFGAGGLLRHVLHDHFAAALGGAHDIGGIDRFVSGYQHKLFHPVQIRQIGHVKEMCIRDRTYTS